SKSHAIASESKQQADLLQKASDLDRENFAAVEAENAELVSQLETEKAENARLRDELEALRRCRPETCATAKSAAGLEGFKSAVHIVRPELEKIVGQRPAIVLQRLSWLLAQDQFGVVLDGRKFIFN